MFPPCRNGIEACNKGFAVFYGPAIKRTERRLVSANFFLAGESFANHSAKLSNEPGVFKVNRINSGKLNSVLSAKKPLVSVVLSNGPKVLAIVCRAIVVIPLEFNSNHFRREEKINLQPLKPFGPVVANEIRFNHVFKITLKNAFTVTHNVPILIPLATLVKAEAFPAINGGCGGDACNLGAKTYSLYSLQHHATCHTGSLVASSRLGLLLFPRLWLAGAFSGLSLPRDIARRCIAVCPCSKLAKLASGGESQSKAPSQLKSHRRRVWCGPRGSAIVTALNPFVFCIPAFQFGFRTRATYHTSPRLSSLRFNRANGGVFCQKNAAVFPPKTATQTPCQNSQRGANSKKGLAIYFQKTVETN